MKQEDDSVSALRYVSCASAHSNKAVETHADRAERSSMSSCQHEFRCHPPWWGHVACIVLHLFNSVYLGAAVWRAGTHSSVSSAGGSFSTVQAVFSIFSLGCAAGAIFFAVDLVRCKRRTRPLTLNEEALRIPLYWGKTLERVVAYSDISAVYWSSMLRPMLIIEHARGREKVPVAFLRRADLGVVYALIAEHVRRSRATGSEL